MRPLVRHRAVVPRRRAVTRSRGGVLSIGESSLAATMMAVTGMAAACVAIWLAVMLASPDHASSVFFGMFGPFAAVAGTWLLVERVARAEPGRR